MRSNGRAPPGFGGRDASCARARQANREDFIAFPDGSPAVPPPPEDEL